MTSCFGERKKLLFTLGDLELTVYLPLMRYKGNQRLKSLVTATSTKNKFHRKCLLWDEVKEEESNMSTVGRMTCEQKTIRLGDRLLAAEEIELLTVMKITAVIPEKQKQKNQSFTIRKNTIWNVINDKYL